MSKSPTSSQLTLIFNSLASLSRNIETETHAPSARIDGLHGLSGEEEDDDDRARSLFLTLHVLFPHELLPALDLLDRGLVTRLLIVDNGRTVEETKPFGSTTAAAAAAAVGARQQQQRPSEEVEFASTHTNNNEVFYIQSSNPSTSNRHHQHRRHKTTTSTPFYEVRLDGWNCTCPAFSVAAFHSLNATGARDIVDDHGPEPEPELEPQLLGTRPNGDGDEGGGSSPTWQFGGVTTNSSSSSSSTPNLRPPSCKHILAAVLAKAAPRLFGHGVTSKVVNRVEIAGWGAGWGEFGGG